MIIQLFMLILGMAAGYCIWGVLSEVHQIHVERLKMYQERWFFPAKEE